MPLNDFQDAHHLRRYRTHVPPVRGTLLAALKASDAEYLITGDKDLLEMAERYPIVTPAKFWATHAGL